MTRTPLNEEIASISSVLGRVRESISGEGWRLSDTELREALREVSAARGGVEAAYLALVREAASRAGSGAAAVLHEAAGVSSAAARRDVAAAVAIGPEPDPATPPAGPHAATAGILATFGDRLATGEVCREHVDVAVRVLDAVPRKFLADQGSREVIVGYLSGVVTKGVGPNELRRMGRHLLDRLDPDRDGRSDPDADQRRYLHFGKDAYDMIVGRFQLDPVAGAQFAAAIAAYSAPAPVPHPRTGETVQPDLRGPGQRNADALSTVVEMALGVSEARRGERPRVVVHVTPEQLSGESGLAATTEGGDVVSGPTLERLACDAVVQRVVIGESTGPLDVGREHRLVTLPQRRALAARDRGCVVCGAPPDWCDAHHVVFWGHGGRSDVSNDALLCPRHHTEVHNGHWLVDHGPDGLRITPPKWVDPTRTPRPPLLPMLEAALGRIEKIELLDEADDDEIDSS